MKRRDANLILVALGALGGGVVVYSLPVPLLERGVRAAGLPAFIPQAAPPLGVTAQALLVCAGIFLCALLVAICLPWRGKKDAGGEQGVRRMSFLFSGLGLFALGRRRSRGTSLEYRPDMEGIDAAPMLHPMDAHPDAPPRSPLFARRDLGDMPLPPLDGGSGEEFIEPAELYGEGGTPEPSVRDITGLAMPRAPEPLPWDLIEQEMNRVLQGVRLTGQDGDKAEDADIFELQTPEPSLAELADRLEKGLARRRARMPGQEGDREHAEAPAQETGSARASGTEMRQEPDRTDEDLERALSALRTITKRAG